MKITMMKLEELVPYDKNPRKHDDSIDELAEGIKEYGFTQPILAEEETNRIATGHRRWKAAEKAGLKEVPVIHKKFKSEAQFKAYVMFDNKTHEKSKWDTDLLSSLMSEIDEEDHELLKRTGFEEREIEALLDTSDIDDLIEDEEVPQSGNKAHVKMVQLFFDEITFPRFIEMAAEVQGAKQIENLTDTVTYCVEKVFNELN